MGVAAYHFALVGLIPAWSLAMHGYLFVDFFFVLSGFVIAASYGERLAGGFSRVHFAVLRLGRVYPVHFVMVCLFVAAALATKTPAFADNRDGWHLLRALFLLDGYATTKRNFFVGQSWSISVELLLYAGFALLAGKGRAAFVIATALAAFALTCLVAGWETIGWSTSVQRGIFGFVLGAGVWFGHRRGLGQSLQPDLFAAASLAIALVFVASAGWLGQAQWLAGLPFSLVVLAFVQERGWLSRVLASAPCQALGAWSYGIYLSQFFVISVAGHLALRWRGGSREGESALFLQLDLTPAEQAGWTMAVLLAILVLSALLHRLVEEPGRLWSRRWVQKRRDARPETAISAT